MTINLIRYGEGHPIVFFHGWGFDHHVWLPLVPALQQQNQIILVDLPGFGSTTFMEWALFKEQLLDQLPEVSTFVGWSLGGLYAQRVLVESPDCVSSLISITSAPRFLAAPQWPGVSQELFTQFYQNLSADAEGTLKQFVALQLNRHKVDLPLGRMPSQKGLEAGLHVLDSWDFRQDLYQITKPVCYMFGRLDPLAPAQLMQVMQKEYPQFNYVFFNRAAHMPFLSHQEEFLSELKRWL